MTLRRPRCETWGWACSATTLQTHANAASERPPRERRVTGANTPARGPSSDAEAPGHKRAPAPAAAGGSGRQPPRPPRQPGVALLPEAATRPLADEWTALGPWSQCLLRPQQVGHAAPATKDWSPRGLPSHTRNPWPWSWASLKLWLRVSVLKSGTLSSGDTRVPPTYKPLYAKVFCATGTGLSWTGRRVT